MNSSPGASPPAIRLRPSRARNRGEFFRSRSSPPKARLLEPGKPPQRPKCNARGWPVALAVLTVVLCAPPHVGHANTVPDTAAAHVNRGIELMEQNRFELAAQQFTVALQLEPESSEAHFQLGVCDFVLEKLEQAREEFARVNHKEPGQPSAIYYLGRLDLQQGNLDGAISRLGQIASAPPFPDTSFYLGQAYFKRGRP